jgi:hypothetical protein
MHCLGERVDYAAYDPKAKPFGDITNDEQGIWTERIRLNVYKLLISVSSPNLAQERLAGAPGTTTITHFYTPLYIPITGLVLRLAA